MRLKLRLVLTMKAGMAISDLNAWIGEHFTMGYGSGAAFSTKRDRYVVRIYDYE